MLFATIDLLGLYGLNLCKNLGKFTLFITTVIKTLFTTKLRFKKVLLQIEQIGVNSLLIVILTGSFAGAVLAFQSYSGFKRFGGQDFIGPVVALSMTRELGPVLTGLMVTGRASSAIAAEIGTMQITEQLDALRTMCVNIWQYLMVPRIVATTLILPFLSLFTMFFGTLGGYLVAVKVLHLNGEEYLANIKRYVQFSDIISGLIKSALFGLILSWVGCYKGFYTYGGARGVGLATTKAVVLASIMILIANYFLTALLFE